MTRELTGRHVLAICVTAFAVIIAANLTMLFSAVGTFPGLVVQNAYVASQGWNDRTAAQQALGWRTEMSYADGVLSIGIRDQNGRVVEGLDLAGNLGRPTTQVADQALVMATGPEGYQAVQTLAPGVWHVMIRSASPRFETTGEIFVPEGR
ncbi:MAG: FixH family protein [Pseudomonadota bacterium]